MAFPTSVTRKGVFDAAASKITIGEHSSHEGNNNKSAFMNAFIKSDLFKDRNNICLPKLIFLGILINLFILYLVK